MVLFRFFILVQFCVVVVDLYLMFELFACLSSWCKHNMFLAGCFTFWDHVNFLMFVISLWLVQWGRWKTKWWKYLCWRLCFGRPNCWSVGVCICSTGISVDPAFPFLTLSVWKGRRAPFSCFCPIWRNIGKNTLQFSLLKV